MSDQIRVPGLHLRSARRRTGELPAVLRTTNRSSSTEIDPLLSGVAVEVTYALGAASRGDGAPRPTRGACAKAANRRGTARG